VFLSVEDPLRWKVVLDDVLEGAIVPQQAQLDDVVAELFPLHGLVAVDIDFFKKVNQGKGDLMLEFFIFFIVIQMIEHTRDKLINWESFLALLKTLFDGGHFLTMKHLEDLVLSDLLIIFFTMFGRLLLTFWRTGCVGGFTLLLLATGGH